MSDCRSRLIKHSSCRFGNKPIKTFRARLGESVSFSSKNTVPNARSVIASSRTCERNPGSRDIANVFANSKLSATSELATKSVSILARRMTCGGR